MATYKKIEDDYLAAVERIRNGKVNHPVLVERAKAGMLKLNFSTVAMESGRARGPISVEDSQFPKVRAAILSPVSVEADIIDKYRNESLQQHLLRARKEIREMEVSLRHMGTKLVSALRRVAELEKAQDNSQRKDRRIARRSIAP